MLNLIRALAALLVATAFGSGAAEADGSRLCRPRVGATRLLGLALLAAALTIGAAKPDPQKPMARHGKPIEQYAACCPAEPLRTTLWCGHDLSVYRPPEERSRFAREDGGSAPLRNLGDFNGDGKDDVLLRHEDGRWHYYPMSGRRVLSGSGPVDLPQDVAWQIAGIGDFNGDGNDDVLLRKDYVDWVREQQPLRGRDWHIYAMDGRRVLADSGPVSLDTNLDSTFNWQVAVGDFDGDGGDEVLLRSSRYNFSARRHYSQWHYYGLDGRRVLSNSGRARLTQDEAWRIAGIADFNGDGKDDVLLRKTDGRWYFYPMNGRSVLPGRGTVGLTRDLAWQVVGTGHFDGDVRKSVLLRHPNGRWRYYGLQGRQVVIGPHDVNLTTTTSEMVAGIGDLNGDGHTDVLVRRAEGGWGYYALYGGRAASPGTGLSGAAPLSEDLAWGALSCTNQETGTTLPGRTLVDGQDETISLSFLSRAFGNDETLTYQVRAHGPDVVRASVTGSVLTLMPVTAGTATVTATARDLDHNTATQAFAVRVARDTFQDCAECPQMVIVPTGTFVMGSPEDEVWRQRNEGPQRAVSIPSFAASAHEVTFAQWDECAADAGCESVRFSNEPGGLSRVAYYPDDQGWGRGDRPVIEVSWWNAQSYVHWLSRRFGQPYRLLTESEWEYAARAGTTTPFHTGETITPRQANFNGGYGYPTNRGVRGLYRRQTVPVGRFAPNRFGLYDMHGNVGEWVQDCYGSYSTAPSDGSAVDRADCGRVMRGGSWYSLPAYIRSAFRYADESTVGTVGFRVARTL